jgi:hypothetical protein
LSPAVPAPPVAWRTGFETDRIEVGEGDVFVRLVVRAPLNLTAEYLVLLIVEPGAAIAGKDFVLPARDWLKFGPGNYEETVLIPLVSDAIGEYIEDFSVRLASPQADIAMATTVAQIIVVDDD